LVVSSACAAYALRRSFSVNYALEEHPIGSGADWGGESVFKRLLESGSGLCSEDDVLDEALHITPAELLTSGWHRIGYQLSEGVHRIVVEPSSVARPSRLTPRELAACQLAALGWKSRRIGSELGVAAATARGAVDRSVAKLRLASSIQVPLVWHTLAAAAQRIRGERSRTEQGGQFLLFERQLSGLSSDRLTQAERVLFERLLLGDSYRDIAVHRGVSVRTVANQMSRLYERFDVSGRAALVAALLAPPGAIHGAER
jgi:DNA-binding NarL/FixJ family response regulator